MTARGARLVLALIVLSGGLAGGCVAPGADEGGTVDGVDPAVLAARNDAVLADFDRYRVRGGLGIWNDEQSLTARIDWRQRGDALEVELDAPLGLGTARLFREGGRARLERGDAAPIEGVSADTVLQRALGLDTPVPLEQLALWIRGLPGEGRDVRRDERGRLSSLRWTDAGGTPWQARVLDRTTLDGLSLPRLLTASGAGYRLRLVLREWSADVPDRGSSGSGSSAGAGSRRLVIPGR